VLVCISSVYTILNFRKYSACTVWAQGTNGGGERSSSATSYLTPDVVARNNLHVLLNTRTTRILQSNASSSEGPEFDKVEVVGNGQLFYPLHYI
jgi:hypothetical protein